jgi:transcriptional regulator with XRE-family HTH domain
MKQINFFETSSVAISPDERAFFVQLGTHIADLRKQFGITQIQLANRLDVSQQTINSYEVARRRVPVSALPTLANVFQISIDELLGGANNQTGSKRGPTPKLQKQLERVSTLPRSKQKFVSEMIDTVIQQAS